MSLSIEDRVSSIEAEIPNGTAFELALLSRLPTYTDPSFAVEIDYVGYERYVIPEPFWITSVEGSVVTRRNIIEVTFVEVPTTVTMAGWALFAEDGETLVWYGLLRNGAGVQLQWTLGPGDVPRFLRGELCLIG